MLANASPTHVSDEVESAEALSSAERRAVAWQRRRQQWQEYLRYDSSAARSLIGISGLAGATALRALGRRQRALQLEAAVHRAAFSPWADRVIEGRFAHSVTADRALYLEHIARVAPEKGTQVFFDDPARLLGSRILALKSPCDGEKGVLALDYLFVFPLFARMFDLQQIAQKYHLVLEPSWSGFCNFDLLCYLAYDFPVFVQNYEPRDAAFIEGLSANLINIPIAANWWVDLRVFHPLPEVERDADIMFLAMWAAYKRHDAFFAALASLRARGQRLKTILVGYPGDMTQNDILRLARDHGVADQLEIFERVPPAEVNRLLNRVKVNVLWSRREGINRAIIEGFFAGTPGIMREGFNYGYAYPYINEHTGSFATEQTLPDRLLDVVQNFERYSPREWIAARMTPQHATAIIDEHLASYSQAKGEKWTPDQLAVKVTSLNTMNYWDEADRQRFTGDYDFLRTMLRG